MNPQERIKELENGCGKCNINKRLLNLRPNADLTKWSCSEGRLCNECNLKIETYKQATKDIIEEIDKRIKAYDSEDNDRYTGANGYVLSELEFIKKSLGGNGK